MAMIVAHNLNAISTTRNLNNNSAMMSKSLEKLSSGYKINTGADDPSGLIISEQLRAQTAGLQRAVQNTQEANNVLGIAEGALSEMNNILKKMRQLAIHAANNGVTSPEQVAADQAEIDSSVQTLDRIARTTKFSDQFLLNGNKQLSYDSTLLVTDSNDHGLLDHGLTNIKQIFKRNDFKLNINFSGLVSNAAGQSIDNGNSAQKGYFEISKVTSPATQIITGQTGADRFNNYTLSKDQVFTLNGVGGSRALSFARGTHLGEMVSAINSVVDSTGVKANLIFDADTTITNVTSTDPSVIADNATRASGSIDVYNRTDLGDITTNGISQIQIANTTAINFGQNCDGFGRVYLKMIDDDTYVIYKDQAMTMKVGGGDLVGTTGTTSTQVLAANNSGLNGITFTAANMSAGMTSIIQLGYMQEDIGTITDGLDMSEISTASAVGTAGFFVTEGSNFSGIRLGENTSDTGKLYIKGNLSSSGTSTIYVYKDERMRDDDLIATSGEVDLTGTGGGAVRIYAVQLGASGATSGLYGTLNFEQITASNSFNAMISTENLGVRMSTVDYGSNQFVKVSQSEGALWTYYTDLDGGNLLDAGLTGAEWANYGRDAKVSINGQQVKLNGINGSVANLDTSADLAFREGSLGCTTIATVGYDVGSFGSRAGQIYNDADNFVCHALKSTTEILGDWTGGMQFQLGEGAGDQERTIFSIRDITANTLGRVKFYDAFTEGSSIKSDRYMSVNDLLAGGWASLSTDPIKAMTIIDQAITDVSGLRAELGAFQANMLQTNANSLSVAIENITKTESYIRDADMAYESTQFSKNQIMVQAGTSMLAQANQSQQNVLSLLGG